MMAVITGVGAITPLGADPTAMAQAVQAGRTPFVASPWGPPVALAPEPPPWPGRLKNARYLTRAGRLTLAAALQAAANAGLQGRLGQAHLVLGLGPHLEPPPPQALWLLSAMPATTTAVTAAALGLTAEATTLLGACAASTQALVLGARAVAEGRAPVVLAGGGDSRTGERAVAAYAAAGVLAAETMRPFDQDRDGFVPAEGAAVVVLESPEHAAARGARVLARIVGTGLAVDGARLTDPAPAAMAQAVRAALAGDAVDPARLLVLAHGTATQAGDAAEAAMLEEVLGPDFPGAVTALKGWLGHGAAACGAMELALLLACLEAGFVPPTPGLARPCTSLPVLRAPRPGQPGWVLLESFGFGGVAAALLLAL